MRARYAPPPRKRGGGQFGPGAATTQGLLAPNSTAGGSNAASGSNSGSNSSNAQQLGPDGAPLRPATKQELHSLKRLAQVITRMFYEDQAVMIMDQIAKFEVIPADLLWSRLSVGPKDLKAQIQKLVEDRLVEIYVRSEVRPVNPNRPPQPEERAARPIRRTYYVLDLPTFYSIIKWRISRIYKSIDSLTSSISALTSRGYLCPQCGAKYDSFDAQHLIDFTTNTLRCETPGCGEALKEDEDKEMAKRKEDKMQRFNAQFGRIMAGLRLLDSIALPKLNVEAWLQLNASTTPWRAYDISDPEIRALQGESVKIAPGRVRRAEQEADADGISLAKGGNAAMLGGLTVDVSSLGQGGAEGSAAAEEVRRLKAEADVRRTREQNALPDWHLSSTVSGERTALGLEEERRRALRAGEYALVDADEAKRRGVPLGSLIDAATGEVNAEHPGEQQRKDALAEYYASAQWGEEDDYEEEEEEDFEEVAQAPTIPTPAAQNGTLGKRPAEQDPDATDSGEGQVDKKPKREQQSNTASATTTAAAAQEAPAAGNANGTGGDDEEEEEEEEEFEEV